MIDHGYIVIDGRLIKEVAPGNLAAEEGFQTIIDAQGMVAMPGLINAHTHAGMTLLRGYADDLPLMEWLQNKIWPFESRMIDEDYYWGTMLGILEMLKSGTTCFADMYFKMDEIARAVSETGIRANLARGMVGVSPEADFAFTDSRELAARYHGNADGRITMMLGPHAPYTCDPDYLKRVTALSDELQLGIHIHLSETLTEVQDMVSLYGKRPVELMKDTGLFSRPVLAAHCVHLTDAEIDMLASNQVAVAHNPESNMKLASGIAPVPDMLNAGITVCLGTDGAASNNNLDLFQEMRSCALLHKVNTMNPLAIPAYQALEMVTVNGARALGLKDVGTLKSGKKADLILIDFTKPHLYPRHDIYAHLVYSMLASDVDTVIINGDIIMEGRKFLHINETRVFDEVTRCVARLTSVE